MASQRKSITTAKIKRLNKIIFEKNEIIRKSKKEIAILKDRKKNMNSENDKRGNLSKLVLSVTRDTEKVNLFLAFLI